MCYKLNVEERSENTTSFIGVSNSLDKTWVRGGSGENFTRLAQFISPHGLKSQKEDYTKKTNYLSSASAELRWNCPSTISSHWRFSKVLLFVIAPLLSLYWESIVRVECCSKCSMSPAHTCSNEEVMLLTLIKTFLSHRGWLSSSLRNITQEEIKDNLSITRITLGLEGFRSVICGISLPLNLPKKMVTNKSTLR